MSIKNTTRRAIVSTVRSGLAMTGETGRRLLSEATAINGEPLIELYETVETAYGPLRFYCLGELSLERVRTLFTKEPETIEWIDTFKPGCTFWDIGANIGLYSIYAAARGCKVLAFEPSAANYFLLNRNIEANTMDDRVSAYCLAFSEGNTLDVLNMRNTGLGGALSSFGVTVDESGKQFTPSFRQGMIGYSIDEFRKRYGLPCPDHIKIDVDGIEDSIVYGAGQTLSSVQSVSIELDTERDNAKITKQLAMCGLKMISQRHAPMFDNSKYASIYNCVFAR